MSVPLPLLIAAVALITLLGALAYVRAAPSGAAWHVDPEVEGRRGRGRWLLAEGGDAPPLHLPVPPSEALSAFDRVAREAGARRLAWEPGRGRASYVARSRLLGFPDYVSVKASPEGAGSRLSAYSRLRFGIDDLGVNRARLERWRARLEAVLAPGG